MRDFREALWDELISPNSLADLPLRGNVVDSPNEGNSRGFQIGEPSINNMYTYIYIYNYAIDRMEEE